ncbi:MAG: hypothetical protein QM778_31295 [Myxococcales bacterium]
MSDYEDYYARWSYEQLRLQQPHVKFGGLWHVGPYHFIVCPGAKTAATLEGEDLGAWFDGHCRVLGSAIELVESAPSNAELVPERSSADRALLAGAPRNRRDVLVDLGLALPQDFPAFTVDNPKAEIVLVTNQELDASEQEAARIAYQSLGYHRTPSFSVDRTRDLAAGPFRRSYGDGDISLIPSRRLQGITRELRFLVEDDEQAWVDSRVRLFSEFEAEPGNLLPAGWERGKRLGCVVDGTVFRPANIRTYLSLYEVVYLALPLADAFEDACAALGVTQAELAKLVLIGRVKLLLPQPLDRYPLDWLCSVAESAPTGLLFSRRLAAATISDARRRVPFLFPPLSPAERYTLLHALSENAAEIVGASRQDRFARFLGEIGAAWCRAEWAVQDRGAMGTMSCGIGVMASALYEQIRGADLRLELTTAAQKVEWAAALGAHVFPATNDGYDESNACDLVAGIYGTLKAPSRTVPPSALSTITDLLAIDNRVSVVDFANEFSSADIVRLRQLVLRLTRENIDEDFLKDAVAKFNAEVRRYEKRPDLLGKVNVVGLFSAGATAMGAVDPTIKAVVPLAGFVLGFIVNRALEELPRHSAHGGAVVDFCNAALSGRFNSEPVLVARAKKEVARLKR